MGAGYLLPEWKASQLANERYLKWKLLSRRQNKETLKDALGTYLATALAGPVGLGFVTGLEKRKGAGPGLLRRLGKLFRLIK